MAEQPTSTMSDTDAQNENNASDKKVDVKDNFVQTDPDEFCTKICPADLTLIIEGKSLVVSRALLGNLSPVFDTMFSGDFREKDNQTVTLPGKKFNNFVEFMRCMNPRISKPVTVDNVYDVLPLAHEYEVKHLLISCETTLIKLSESAADELYYVLKIATMYNLNELTSKCIKIAAERPPGEIEEVGRTNELDTNTINAVKSLMLTNLTTKHKDIFVHITTSEAMYRVLGIQSKQLKLVTAFKNGQVFGDFKKLRLSTAFDKSIDMCINGDIYSMKIYGSSYDEAGRFLSDKFTCLATKCKSVKCPTGQCVIGIYIKNWMKQENEIYLEKTFIISSSDCIFVLPKEYSVSYLLDITAGYVRQGMLDIELFLFIVNK